MSDKTKRLRDNARIEARIAEERAQRAAKGDTRPRCACGLTYTDTRIWAIGTPGQPTKFYCGTCIPLEMLHLIGGSP